MAVGKNTGGNTADKVDSVQVDDFKSHTHAIRAYQGASSWVGFLDGEAGSASPTNNVTNPTGGNETTRPLNAYVNFIVKQ